MLSFNSLSICIQPGCVRLGVGECVRCPAPSYPFFFFCGCAGLLLRPVACKISVTFVCHFGSALFEFVSRSKCWCSSSLWSVPSYLPTGSLCFACLLSDDFDSQAFVSSILSLLLCVFCPNYLSLHCCFFTYILILILASWCLCYALYLGFMLVWSAWQQMLNAWHELGTVDADWHEMEL